LTLREDWIVWKPKDGRFRRILFLRIGALFAAGLSAALFPGAALASEILPDIKSLPELKLELVLDLSDHSDVGLPWAGRISPRGDFVFFDVQLRRVMIMPFSGRGGRTIGSFGEGPGEYQNVLDIRLEDDGILILDSRGRLIEFGWEGRWKRERKLPGVYDKILGRIGEDVYLSGRIISPESFFDKAVVKWREGEKAVPLFKMSSDAIRTQASTLDGKSMTGGMFTLSEPAFAFLENGFAAAADSRYRILHFDPAGKERSSWEVKAPDPEYYGRMFGMYNGKRSAYAVRDMFPLPGAVAVVGNFFRDGKPRLDVFDRTGKRTSSWVIPLSCEAPYCRCQIEGEYLIHFSSEEGTRIYRMISRL
jgi:hypothetical protein